MTGVLKIKCIQYFGTLDENGNDGYDNNKMTATV